MQLFIRTNSKTVTLLASEEDTILNLKQKIEEKEGIPLSYQKLKCSTHTLPDFMNLSDCKIVNNSTLLLSLGLEGGVQIHVKQIGRKEPINLEMDLSDTIQSLKSKIEAQEGIPSDELKLAYRGKSLSNEAALRTIKQLEAKGECTFLLTQKKSPASAAAKTTTTKSKKEETKSEPAQLCANNCGFYGTAANGGYCSSCFKELKLVKESSKDEPEEEPEVKETPEEERDPKDIQTDTTHCWGCKRKVGLLGFTCKCNYTFCAEHRYSDKHDCTFDYQARERNQLVKKLEKVEDKKGLHN